MKDILPYLKPYRRRIALAMLLVAAATVCDLLLPTIMNDILNHGVRQSDFAYIVRCCAWMLAVAATFILLVNFRVCISLLYVRIELYVRLPPLKNLSFLNRDSNLKNSQARKYEIYIYDSFL